jgi:hypothetical protein
MTFALLAMILTAEPMLPAPPLVSADGVVQAPPSRLKYRGTVPAGYHLVEAPNWAVITPGIVVLTMAYVPWAALGTMLGSPENLVPIVGPILAYRPASGWFSTVANVFSIAFIGADVIAQLAGTVTLIVGLATPRRSLEVNDEGPAISFVPTAGGAPGASIVGRF